MGKGTKQYITGAPRSVIPALCLLLAFVLFPNPTFAQCASPVGSAGQIIYNGDDKLMSYCDDTNWIGIRGSGNDYTPNAVTFDGTNDHLSYATDFTGLADSKMVTLSFWFKNDTSGFSGFEYIYESDNDYITSRFDGASDIWQFGCRNTSNTTILNVDTGATTFLDDQWHHIMMSIDLGNPTSRHLYVDGVSTLNVTTYTDDTCDFTDAPHALFSNKSGSVDFDGDIADFWMDFGTYIDLSDSSNRAKFYNNGPVRLGADGSSPTGSAPEIFLSGNTANWHTNKSGNGGFTEVGALTTAATFPGQTDTSLIGHWKLDETSGTTAVDSSPTGQNGTLAGGLDAGNDSVSGKIGTSLDFDATDDYVNIGSPAIYDDMSQATYAAWIYPLSSGEGGTGQVFYKRGGGSSGWQFNLQGAVDNIVLRYNYSWTGSGGTWETDAGSIKENQWQHVAVSYDRTADTNDPILYINGVAVNVTETGTPTTAPYSDATHNLQVGGQSNGFNIFEGRIDDARVYNRILTPLEIGELSAACEEGSIIYNADHHVPQYCAGGDNWVAMGPVRDGIDSGLVGHYTLNETGGSSANDTSGNSNHGSMLNFTAPSATSPGKVSRSFDFDGNNDRIDIASSATIDDVFLNGGGTWAAWINARSSGQTGYGRIIDKRWNGGSPSLLMNFSSEIVFETKFSSNHGIWTTPAVNLNEWYHVALTYDHDSPANDPVIYLNGVAQSLTEVSTPSGTPFSDAGDQLSIGNINNATTRTWDGYIDDVRVYNRPLSPAEIMALYELGLENDSSLVAHWPLDEQSGQTVEDIIGGVNGTYQTYDVAANLNSTAGVHGNALTFDAPQDQAVYTTAATPLEGLNNLSVSLWFYPYSDDRKTILSTTVNNNQTLVEMVYQANTDALFRVYDTTAANSASTFPKSNINIGEWNNLILTYDGTTRAYVNGALVDTASTTGLGATRTQSSGTTYISFSGFSGAYPADGRIDDVRMYDRTLSLSDIQALYNAGIGYCTSPVGKEGDLIYNDDVGVDALQYCDGSNWQMIGKSP